MLGRRALSILVLILLSFSTLSTLALHTAQAQQGTLYVLPAHTDTLPVGTNFNVKIQVANIDPFNAWDISIQSDPTVISPQSLTITGNLLAINFSTTVFELINCINGAGTGCIATDGAGIAHSAVTGFGPPPQTTTSSGLLFTITYKVIGPGFSTIHIFSDVIANGATGAAVPHFTLDGSYGLIVPFDYSLSNSGGITATQGGSGSNMISATLTGGATQTVTLSCSSGLPSGASCAFTPSPSGSPTFSATLTISTLASTPTGMFTITVTGTPLGATTAPTTFTLTVAPPQVFDYSLSVSPASDSVLAGSDATKTTIVTATLTSGTTTSVTLSAKVTGPTNGAGVSVTGFNPIAVTPSAIGATSIMTVSVAAGATLGTWTIEITGNPPGASTPTVTYTLTVTTNQPPVASFTVTGNNTITGSTVSFNGGASSDPDGSVVSYAWTFGDGGTATGVTTTHVYTTAGKFTVTLTVTDNSGSTGTASAKVGVVDIPPTASFTVTGNSTAVGSTISFDASTSVDPDGTISVYAWDFGDGVLDTGVMVNHVYAAAGVYTVTLAVVDNSASSSSATVKVEAGIPPIASFTYPSGRLVVGESITFDATTSHDPDGSILTWAWSFDDNECSPQPDCSSAMGETAQHTFTGPGHYDVSLKVTDNDLTINTTTQAVLIVQPDLLVTSVSVSPTGSVTIGQKVTFTVIVLNGGTTNESFTIRVWWGSTVAQQDASLLAGQQKTYTLAWDTTGLAPATHKTSATVSTAEGETKTSDNSAAGPDLSLVAASQPVLPASEIPLVAGGAAAIILALVLIGFSIFRRRRGKTPTL